MHELVNRLPRGTGFLVCCHQFSLARLALADIEDEGVEQRHLPHPRRIGDAQFDRERLAIPVEGRELQHLTENPSLPRLAEVLQPSVVLVSTLGRNNEVH